MRMLVTPEMAAEMLAKNTHNRRLNPQRVSEYARDMVAGKWPYNGESIKVTHDGTIVDGQHRLEAIVLSGVTIETEVISDLPLAVQYTIDVGRGRSVADQLVLNKEHYTRNLAAVARRAWQWDQKNYRFSTKPNPTQSEVLATIERYTHLRRSSELGHRVATGFKPAKAAVISTAHHLFHQLDQDATAVFIAQMETGASLKEGHPVLALRNRLTQDKIYQRSYPFYVSVGCCIRAWNAVREGKELSIIRMGAEHPMPMPI